MGCNSSSPNAVTTSEKKTFSRGDSGEVEAQKTIARKKQIARGLVIVGQSLPSDYEMRTYAKNDRQRAHIMAELKSHDILSNLDENEMTKVINAFEPIHFKAGDKIIKQGDNHADFCYVMESGEAAVFVDDKDINFHYHGKGLFGDLALMMNKRRAATVEAVTDCKIWRLDRTTFQFTLSSGSRKEHDRKKQALMKSSLLKEASEETLEKLVGCAYKINYEKGTIIIKKGDRGDQATTFYFLTSGTIEFSDIAGGGLSQITPESELNYFGERALISDEPRAATATAITNVECIVLDKKDFFRTIGDLGQVMEANYRLRFLSALPLLKEIPRGPRKAVITRAFSQVEYNANETIILQGQVGTTFFVIREGKVNVLKDGVKQAELGVGQWFGEGALMTDMAVREATVSCLERTVLYALDKEEFQTHIGGPLSDILTRERARRDKKAAAKERGKSIQFSDLKEVAMLGSGTFGKVKLVLDKKGGRTYALKAMQKAQICEYKQQQNVQNERDIMVEADHPFILKLVNTFQDSAQVYMLLEVCLGGELFTLLHCHNRSKGLSAIDTRFYSACVLDGLAFLHEKSICYRDLKPENLLLDSDGFIKIVDFGFAKIITGKSYTLCGTPEYLSPELVTSKGHNKGVDYWALGVLIFEMLFLHSPFCRQDHNPNDHASILRNIVRGAFKIPGRGDCAENSPLGKLIVFLLQKDVRKRGGCTIDGSHLLKKMMEQITPSKPFSMTKLFDREYIPPWKPPLKGAMDHSNFDPYDENDEIREYVGTKWEDKSGWDKDF
jgi:CRP-like cAMP-binding protein